MEVGINKILLSSNYYQTADFMKELCQYYKKRIQYRYYKKGLITNYSCL